MSCSRILKIFASQVHPLVWLAKLSWCAALSNHPISELWLRGLNVFDNYRKQLVWKETASFRSQIRREISAGSPALSTKVNLYVRRAFISRFNIEWLLGVLGGLFLLPYLSVNRRKLLVASVTHMSKKLNECCLIQLCLH